MFPLFYVGGPISVLIENSNPDVVCDLSLGSIFGNDRGGPYGPVHDAGIEADSAITDRPVYAGIL